VDPNTLDFEMNVDGYVSTGGLSGPAILPLSLAKMAQLTSAFPDKSFSGIGGIAEFAHALNYFLLGGHRSRTFAVCGTIASLPTPRSSIPVRRNIAADMTRATRDTCRRPMRRRKHFRCRFLISL
jgi:hypothetical protein